MKDAFKENGYLYIPEVIPPELITKLKALSKKIEEKALEGHRVGELSNGICVIEDPVGPRVMRCDDIFRHDFELLNELIAHPKLLRLIKELCGPTAVILQADLLWKQQHPHPVILWHQGAPSEHDSHYLNIGIYLDHARENDGCVRYVPGTQYELQDISKVEENFGWNPPGVVQVPANPGDIVVQEMMVLHASEPKRSDGARRTIYIEVRPYEALVSEARQSQDWIDLRRFWMSEVLKYDENGIYSDEEKLFYNETNPYTKEELLQKLSEVHEPPIPAVYSTFTSQGPGYPIPEDLK